jgi:hypothetical protein
LSDARESSKEKKKSDRKKAGDRGRIVRMRTDKIEYGGEE